ncbi:MAG: rRNA pseudouridine synthase [Deltaproteobacteria bacterium]|jgi:23S rRNA pseudouridine2605 synthase|nr:rRNA pseudouridine synthase [Deltaproteobacteria bacterium]MBT4088242.1 rRNA pseudouridine synthase [Deltaproteobacteria bacterium]MBT4268063.1 rRNA pseudouridine synthase [Deltaproteobacteria bacterium]MBT4641469.1 rRNA pseudouridine synthase [Deltaproteobacteria bacterium]MBT6500084.1 rRNA pseudouridine synthase [Deltaproteobacteria bacterium]
MTIRLQKFIADAGIASRRKAEQLIIDRQVVVNGQIITRLGTQIDPATDRVKVNGKLISTAMLNPVAYALYKPKNCVTTLNDPQQRDTIVNYFPKTQFRLFPVGRLDYDAEGLIILTNDGNLANRITHPSKHVWKQYFVKIKGKISNEEINQIRSGPIIDGKKRQSVKIRFLHFVNDKSWLVVSLQEGVKHHIKKTFLAAGYRVLKIKRYSIGNIELHELSPGECRELSKTEIGDLMQLTHS